MHVLSLNWRKFDIIFYFVVFLRCEKCLHECFVCLFVLDGVTVKEIYIPIKLLEMSILSLLRMLIAKVHAFNSLIAKWFMISVIQGHTKWGLHGTP